MPKLLKCAVIEELTGKGPLQLFYFGFLLSAGLTSGLNVRLSARLL